MTKKLSALFIAFSITVMPALADEGMWLLPLIEKFTVPRAFGIVKEKKEGKIDE